jgi:hypothetical protein
MAQLKVHATRFPDLSTALCRPSKQNQKSLKRESQINPSTALKIELENTAAAVEERILRS